VRNGVKAGAIHYVALVDDLVIGWCDINRPSTPRSATAVCSAWASCRVIALVASGVRCCRRRSPTADSIGLTRVELRVRTDNVGGNPPLREIGVRDRGHLPQVPAQRGRYHDTVNHGAVR
jgi:hypothetical protein